ncbi:FAD-dependent oxidoreductase [Sinomicrobium soli]|nr:FAD-dependent oxidoreductase [Sinomicrobium sp. N-1-3-6]
MTIGVLNDMNAREYDICVYGETSAGVTAAVQAGRMGKSVVLISNSAHVGGTTTSGLTATDINSHLSIGGLSREFYQRIYRYYLDAATWKNQERDAYFQSIVKRVFKGKSDPLKMQWVYESHVAEQIMRTMLLEAGVRVLFNERLDLENGVVKKENTIHKITMESGEEITAKVFIDATYEGDLMAKAGVSYTYGRDANSDYNETYNGYRPNEIVGLEEKGISVDPYRVKGDPASGLLPFIEADAGTVPGSADKRMQSYCYRLTLTDDPANRVPIRKPENYDPLWFEVLARQLELDPAIPLRKKLITLTPMPNRKTDTNHLDFVGANYSYTEGSYEEREKIAALHKDYALGKLWFLANDPRVPEHIREEMSEWGLARDEFVDNGNFPHQLYVREARRMLSDYVMTEHHCTGEEIAPESVGLATYWLDCHYVSMVVDQEGNLRKEGTYWMNTPNYPVSYKSIRPKEKECDNLLVPVCLSASHVAFGSIRMEPVYMVLGQSAATAAALSIDRECSVQDVPYEVLKSRLVSDGQILKR